jgi:uncharacterized protein YggE
MEPKRGRGRPPGSTNKPKAESSLASGEEKIVKRVDDLLDVLINAAVQNQDVKAAQYLINRIYGRPTEKSEITTKGEQTIKVEYVDDWRSQ